MSYLKSNLVPGERIVYHTRLHWIVMLGNLAVGLLLFAAPACGLLYYLYTQRSGLDLHTQRLLEGGAAVLFALALITVIAGLVKRNATEIAVTSRRVVIKTGLAARKTIEMLLNKVESIEVRETTLGRILGYGAIVVVGTGGSTEPFDKIAHPLRFRAALQQQIELPETPVEVVAPVSHAPA